jgi:hypothetical protein
MVNSEPAEVYRLLAKGIVREIPTLRKHAQGGAGCGEC